MIQRCIRLHGQIDSYVVRIGPILFGNDRIPFDDPVVVDDRNLRGFDVVSAGKNAIQIVLGVDPLDLIWVEIVISYPYFQLIPVNLLDTEVRIEIPNAFDVIVGQCAFCDLCIVERLTGNTNAMFFRTENTHFSQRVEQFTVDLNIGYEHTV